MHSCLMLLDWFIDHDIGVYIFLQINNGSTSETETLKHHFSAQLSVNTK